MKKLTKAEKTRADKEELIEGLQARILEDGLAKQEYEKILRACLLVEDVRLYWLILPIIRHAMRISRSISEIRRLRGWLPD